MSVSLHEHRLGSLRWIVLTGPDREAFGALGEHVRAELAALAEAWPALPRLRRHVSGSPGRDRTRRLRRVAGRRVVVVAHARRRPDRGVTAGNSTSPTVVSSVTDQ